MPWKPQFPSVPPHPAQDFDLSVAEVLAIGNGPIAHVLVFAEPYARATGHLWWQCLSHLEMELEIWSFIDGEFEEDVSVRHRKRCLGVATWRVAGVADLR